MLVASIIFLLGHGTIITSHDKLSHYLSLLTNQFPIESNFIALLADNLNAEISLGTVTNVGEAVQWLSYSYLYVRMRKNPLVYGMKYQDVKGRILCRNLYMHLRIQLWNMDVIPIVNKCYLCKWCYFEQR